MAEETIVPLTLPVPLAGALLGVSRPTAYRLAETGGLPLLPVGGRKKVLTSALEKMLGQPISADRLAQAQARIRMRQAA